MTKAFYGPMRKEARMRFPFYRDDRLEFSVPVHGQPRLLIKTSKVTEKRMDLLTSPLTYISVFQKLVTDL